MNQLMNFYFRMFLIVESFGSAFGVGQSTPLNEEDIYLKENIHETVSSLLANCSTKIYEVTIKLLFHSTLDFL